MAQYGSKWWLVKTGVVQKEVGIEIIQRMQFEHDFSGISDLLHENFLLPQYTATRFYSKLHFCIFFGSSTIWVNCLKAIVVEAEIVRHPAKRE